MLITCENPFSVLICIPFSIDAKYIEKGILNYFSISVKPIFCRYMYSIFYSMKKRILNYFSIYSIFYSMRKRILNYFYNFVRPIFCVTTIYIFHFLQYAKYIEKGILNYFSIFVKPIFCVTIPLSVYSMKRGYSTIFQFSLLLSALHFHHICLYDCFFVTFKFHFQQGFHLELVQVEILFLYSLLRCLTYNRLTDCWQLIIYYYYSSIYIYSPIPSS